MAFADGGMVLEAAARQLDALILQMIDFRNARTAEIGILDGIIGELRFGSVDHDLAILRLAVGNGDRHRLDAAFVAAPAGSGIALGEHLMFGYGALAGHQALRHGAAVEQDHLILIIAVIVVPVEHRAGAFARQIHGAHGHGRAHIDFAGSHDAAIIQFRQQHAGAHAHIGFHFVPAAQRQRVQMVFLDIAVDRHGNLRQRSEVLLRHLGKIGIIPQNLLLGDHARIVVRHFLYLVEQFGKIEGFYVDAVLLQRQFIEAHRFKRGGTRADAAQIEALHAVNHAADRGEIAQVFLELRGQRMHHVRLEHRERHAVLAEHVRNGEFSAERIAAMREIHLADFIGIRLHQNRHMRILQRRDRAVFIGEDRHGENHAIVFALVLLEPFGVQQTFIAGFHAAVAGQFLIHDDVIIARIGHGLDHIIARAVDQFAGHEAAVCKRQSKRHLLFHRCTSKIQF